MADHHAVVWTRRRSGPLKMGDLVVTPRETRFSYDDGYLALAPDVDGLALLSSARLFGRNPVVFETRGSMRLHPRLMELIPADRRSNVQRRLLADVLAGRVNPPAPGFETDWELLLLVGRNGIGHLDVFRDDRVAERWYEQPLTAAPRRADRSRLWQVLRDDIALDVELMDATWILELLGPTPSAGGMIPKLLVSIPDRDDWDGSFAGSGTQELEGQRYVDVVLKLEPAEYRGVLALEALCLSLHAESGFEVPRHWRASFDGLELLAVERFDRQADGLPIPLESFYSVFATGDRHLLSNQDTHLAEVAQRLEKLATVVNLDVRATQRELYRRLCFALCTGNGDMHLQNLSLLGGPAFTRLAPVYDPAPMRAWPRHDLRFAVPLDFDESLGGLAENLVALGASHGLTATRSGELIREAMDATHDFDARVLALDTVAAERRERLATIVRRERQLLEHHLPG